MQRRARGNKSEYASGRDEGPREVKRRRNQQQHLLCKECAPVTGRRLLLAAASRRRPLIGGEVTGVRLRLDPADPQLPFTPNEPSECERASAAQQEVWVHTRISPAGY